MKVFSIQRIIKADLGTFTLGDVLNKMEQENFFDDGPFYLVEKRKENHLLFGVSANKMTPKQIHEFEYYKKKKEFEIRSKYGSWFVPIFFIYIMPIYVMIFGREEWTQEEWGILLILILGITFFIVIALYGVLREDSKNIERELVIRFNYLIRQS